MNNEKSIEALNILIEIHNDRIKGYKTATTESEDEALNIVFAEFIKNSQDCNKELIQAVHKLGGLPTEGTNTASKFFRVWMDVKFVLTCNDSYTILKSCEEGEGIAVQNYTTVLNEYHESLSQEHYSMIKAQQVLIKKDQDKVILLFESSLAHE